MCEKQKYFQYGSEAYRKGLPLAPCNNAEFMQIVYSLSTSKDKIKAMKIYSEGWTIACINDGII